MKLFCISIAVLCGVLAIIGAFQNPWLFGFFAALSAWCWAPLRWPKLQRPVVRTVVVLFAISTLGNLLHLRDVGTATLTAAVAIIGVWVLYRNDVGRQMPN